MREIKEELPLSDNEKVFIEAIVNHKANVFKAQQAIQEKFGLESEFNETENELLIICPTINESLQGATAKEYVESLFDEDMLSVKLK